MCTCAAPTEGLGGAALVGGVLHSSTGPTKNRPLPWSSKEEARERRTQVKDDISCANPCDPKGKPSWSDQVIAESCDDFIAQENDDLSKKLKILRKRWLR
jgi:hypothetical protein